MHFLRRYVLEHFLGSQHPSPNVKNFPGFQPQVWPEIITSRDAESTCFKGSRTSCDVIIFRNVWPNFGRKRSHHVVDASCRFFGLQRDAEELLPVDQICAGDDADAPYTYTQAKRTSGKKRPVT